ncbi:MAG TPA: YCF48-related protein [Candidatus Eisenbacteria bacterium]|nr:YCF48-related protein [Candidatus Eisenbacteria bacterium]
MEAQPNAARSARRRVAPLVVVACALGLALLSGCDKGGTTILVPPGGGVPPADDFDWVRQIPPASNPLYGVYFVDSLRGWVVGSAGLILSTRDAGATWHRMNPTTFDLRSVWFTSPADGWAVGAAGTVLATSDSGATWTRVSVTAGEPLNDVWFADASHGIIAGGSGYGVVLWTTDGGATWNRVTPPTGPLRSVTFPDLLDAYAVGDAGVIAGSHDGGKSWFKILPAITAQNLRAVWGRSSVSNWAVGAAGTIAETAFGTDSVTWSLGTSAGASVQLEGVSFPAPTIGYAAGFNGSGVILRTDDAGTTWTPQPAASTSRLNAVFFADSLHGWAVGDNGTIRHTAHGGHE